MSRKRQPHSDPEKDVLVRTYAATHPSGIGIPPRSFAWDQLVYAARGVLSVHTSEGTWIVPPHRAVWIPRGVVHEVELSGRVAFRTLFFAAGIAKRMPEHCQAVNVSPLLRELMLHACRPGALRRDVPEQARLTLVILDQLRTLPQIPLQLPAPRDPRARRAAQLLLRSSRRGDSQPSLSETARGVGSSKRTLERLFRSETHMTLGRWRQRLRFAQALRLLASGHPVTRVALEVGYDSPSAFVHAFRRQMGVTPGRYFQNQPS